MPAHDAIGVEHQHALVVGSPALHEITDVARLALAAVDAPPVEHAALAVVTRDEAAPHGLLLHRDLCVGGIGEEEQVESPLLALAQQRSPDRLESGADAFGVLVVYGHAYCGADVQRLASDARGVDADV